MYSEIATSVLGLRDQLDPRLYAVLAQLANAYLQLVHRGPVSVTVNGYERGLAPVVAGGDPFVMPFAALTARNLASVYDATNDICYDGVASCTQGVHYVVPNNTYNASNSIALVAVGDALVENIRVTGDVQEEDGSLYGWPNFSIDDAGEYWEASSVAGASDWGRAHGYPFLDAASVGRTSGWITDNAWDFGHTTGQFLSSGSVSLDYDSDWTLILAVNIDTLSGGYDPVLWSFGDNGTTKPLFVRVNASGGTVAVVATDNGTTARTTTGTTALAAGANYLLGVTWAASSETLSIYVDGELDVSADLSAYTWPTFTAPQFRVGNRVDNTTGQELDGQVDTVLWVPQCLSARQILWYYQAQNEGAFVGGDRGADIQHAHLFSGRRFAWL